METATTTVTVRYFAAARAAAGVESEPIELPAGGGTVDDVLAEVRAMHGGELARVLERCSFLLDEIAVRDTSTPLRPAATVDVLPPFAGG